MEPSLIHIFAVCRPENLSPPSEEELYQASGHARTRRAVRRRAVLVDVLPRSRAPHVPSSLPAFCFPDGAALVDRRRGLSFHSFVLEQASSTPLHGYALRFDEPQTAVASDARGWYFPTALAVLMRWPLEDAARVALVQLFVVTHSSVAQPLPVERRLCHLLEEVPAPPSAPLPPPSGGIGLLKAIRVHLSAAGDSDRVEPLLVRLPNGADLPASRQQSELLFRQLGVDACLMLVSALLTEGRVLLHAEDPALVVCSAETLRALMHPLEWHHVYVPLLPSSMLEMAKAPGPFLMGTLSRPLAANLPDLEAEMERCLVVDLDLGMVRERGGFRTFAAQAHAPLVERQLPLPAPEGGELRWHLEDILSHSAKRLSSATAHATMLGVGRELNTSAGGAGDASDRHVPWPAAWTTSDRINACFLAFFTSLFSEYRRFSVLLSTGSADEPLVLFHREAFLQRWRELTRLTEHGAQAATAQTAQSSPGPAGQPGYPGAIGSPSPEPAGEQQTLSEGTPVLQPPPQASRFLSLPTTAGGDVRAPPPPWRQAQRSPGTSWQLALAEVTTQATASPMPSARPTHRRARSLPEVPRTRWSDPGYPGEQERHLMAPAMPAGAIRLSNRVFSHPRPPRVPPVTPSMRDRQRSVAVTASLSAHSDGRREVPLDWDASSARDFVWGEGLGSEASEAWVAHVVQSPTFALFLQAQAAPRKSIAFERAIALSSRRRRALRQQRGDTTRGEPGAGPVPGPDGHAGPEAEPSPAYVQHLLHVVKALQELASWPVSVVDITAASPPIVSSEPGPVASAHDSLGAAREWRYTGWPARLDEVLYGEPRGLLVSPGATPAGAGAGAWTRVPPHSPAPAEGEPPPALLSPMPTCSTVDDRGRTLRGVGPLSVEAPGQGLAWQHGAERPGVTVDALEMESCRDSPARPGDAASRQAGQALVEGLVGTYAARLLGKDASSDPPALAGEAVTSSGARSSADRPPRLAAMDLSPQELDDMVQLMAIPQARTRLAQALESAARTRRAAALEVQVPLGAFRQLRRVLEAALDGAAAAGSYDEVCRLVVGAARFRQKDTSKGTSASFSVRLTASRSGLASREAPAGGVLLHECLGPTRGAGAVSADAERWDWRTPAFWYGVVEWRLQRLRARLARGLATRPELAGGVPLVDGRGPPPRTPATPSPPPTASGGTSPAPPHNDDDGDGDADADEDDCDEEELNFRTLARVVSDMIAVGLPTDTVRSWLSGAARLGDLATSAQETLEALCDRLAAVRDLELRTRLHVFDGEAEPRSLSSGASVTSLSHTYAAEVTNPLADGDGAAGGSSGVRRDMRGSWGLAMASQDVAATCTRATPASGADERPRSVPGPLRDRLRADAVHRPLVVAAQTRQDSQSSCRQGQVLLNSGGPSALISRWEALFGTSRFGPTTFSVPAAAPPTPSVAPPPTMGRRAAAQ